MFTSKAMSRALTVLALSAAFAAPATADDVRNVKRGEPAPAYRLPAIDGTIIDSTALQGSVVVVVCLSANQRRSELAAMDSSAVMAGFAPDKVRFIHVTADVIEKPYFEKFRADRSISLPLAFDADRDWYARLGLVVFPTTLVIDKEGKLAQVISLHSNAYKHTLTAYIDRALGTIDDKELEKRLAEQVASDSSPKSHASALRALARSMREKGRPAEAKAELTKALEQEPDNREVMLDLAELDLQIKDLDGADEMADKVLAAQPDHRRARQIKGIILFYRDRLDEAKVMLEDALALNPSPETAHYYLGRICEKKGDQAGALDHYREALRRYIHEPSTPSASAPADPKPAK
ncbi:MAG: Beta-barrel assembly-enhancing protease [Phycisphaerales bacterium]|nr:Beta-barrel assembly-enhancing protease [Phycisphaerales bacterium]